MKLKLALILLALALCLAGCGYSVVEENPVQVGSPSVRAESAGR